MDEKFQDRIDRYLLHADSMTADEKRQFMDEVEQDDEKREQLEFTKNLKEAVCSRESKLKALAEMERRYDYEHGRSIVKVCYEMCPPIEKSADMQFDYDAAPKSRRGRAWLWAAGIAVAVVVGFFAIRPVFFNEASPDGGGSPIENMRGGEGVFDGSAAMPADTLRSDTVGTNTNHSLPADE